MKKGMRALKSFSHIEMGRVFQALQQHRTSISKMDQLLFDLVYIKLARRKNLHQFRDVVFDGMEMKLISRALRERGLFYIDIKKYLTSVRYFELAQVVEEDRYQFQKLNGPRVGPQIGPQMKKTPTVGAAGAIG